jgi:ABC-type antimicrobial peptide transport system permease subunit
MEEVLDESLAQRRFQMDLVLMFAATALLLATFGIYGVISYSVALRTNEMGIRMALGAHGANILTMILRQAMTPVAIGIGGGLAAFLAAGRLMAGLLYGVAPVDGPTIESVVLILATVATSASVVPAWRASRVDPMIALRYE